MYRVHLPGPEVRLSEKPHIRKSAVILHSALGEWTSIGPRNRIVESEIGDYTYTMEEVTIHYARIGKYGSIASHVCINPVQHPMERVTQHHMTYRRVSYGLAETDDEAIFRWRRTHRVEIGHDVWIGHGAIVMKGVRVGHGAVIGSGSVVTKDVEPYTIVAGVPARPIKRRFPEDITEQLLQIAWWDWPREVLEERFYDFYDLHGFIAKYGKPN